MGSAAVEKQGHLTGDAEKGRIDTRYRIDVPKVASDEQVRFFVENGYLIIENLITPIELEELKTDTNFIARGGYPSKSLKPLPTDMSDAEVLKNITVYSPATLCQPR